jgi:hypothetical protein
MTEESEVRSRYDESTVVDTKRTPIPRPRNTRNFRATPIANRLVRTSTRKLNQKPAVKETVISTTGAAVKAETELDGRGT